jgi:aminoglycoside 6'-N-acetyltransferase
MVAVPIFPTPPAVTLRPATRGDDALIERWIRTPDIQRWWGDTATAFAEVQLARQSESALCRIIEAAGRPVGYAQAIDAALWGPQLPDGMPPGTYDVDLFVAEPSVRGLGVGAAALDLIVAEVFATTLAMAVSVFASLRNEAAVRAYEKAGFRWVRILEDPSSGPMWMMLRQRGGRGAEMGLPRGTRNPLR